MATVTMNFTRAATGELTGICDSDGWLDYENTGSNQSFANCTVNSIKITFTGICTTTTSSGSKKLIILLEDSNSNYIQIYKDRDGDVVLPPKYEPKQFTVYATDNLSSLTGKTIHDMRFECGDGSIFTTSNGVCNMEFTYTVNPVVSISSFTVAQDNKGAATASWNATLTNASGNISYELTVNGSTYTTTGSSGTSKSKTYTISTDLSYGKSYTFTLKAKYSGATTATSSKTITFVAPSISSPSLSLSGSNLTWNASTFSSYLTGSKSYELYKDGVMFTSTSSTSFNLSGDATKDWGQGTFTISIRAVGSGLSNKTTGDPIYSGMSNSVSYIRTITRCIAPEQCAVIDPLSYASTTLEWSGAQPGENNSIVGYNVRYCESMDGTNFGDWTDPIYTTASSMSFYPPSTLGNYYKFEVQTCGSAGDEYHSETWTPSENMLRKDVPPVSGFTDPVLQAGVTKPKAVHMTELQSLINDLLRFHHMNSVSFSGIASQQTSLLDWADHVVEIRQGIDLLGYDHDDWISIPNGLPSAAVVEQMRNILYGYYENRDTRS